MDNGFCVNDDFCHRLGDSTMIVSSDAVTDANHRWITHITENRYLRTVINHYNFSVFLYARLKNGRIMPWQCPSVHPSVCPSVRPSVRLRFPDFSSTCFEISIWNLVYTFSRWHDMSSLSCITIGSLWPSLQPKVDQTNFCNHGLIKQDKFFKFGTQVACFST